MLDETQFPMILKDTGSKVQYGRVKFEKWVCSACLNGAPCICELKQPVVVPPRGCLYPYEDGRPSRGCEPSWRHFDNARDPICVEMFADGKDALKDIC